MSDVPFNSYLFYFLKFKIFFRQLSLNVLTTWFLLQKFLYILALPYLFGAVFQSYLRGCLPGLSSQ